MTTNWDAEFAAIAGQPATAFYPGSSRRIRPTRSPIRRGAEIRPVPPEAFDDLDDARWDAKPQVKKLGDRYVEFFGIGDLAKALRRDAVTIRKWESKGVIPKATFLISGKTSNGNRRLYTREQIEVMVRIAEDEGLFDGDPRGIRITDTRFTERVIGAFKELKEAA
ncbi:MerR family transcriptional regulator [Streptomyces sp. NPDC004528]|uniref:MerR family transcriptional regulator n=1 Tax=Streptomyces sp. NPDC004528 TaxID=3154550 RepID=UPI0033AB2E77